LNEIYQGTNHCVSDTSDLTDAKARADEDDALVSRILWIFTNGSVIRISITKPPVIPVYLADLTKMVPAELTMTHPLKHFAP